MSKRHKIVPPHPAQRHRSPFGPIASLLLACGLAAAAAAAHSTGPATDPSTDPSAGQAPAEAAVEPVAPNAIGAVVSCVICHGAKGEGNTRLGAPRVGGLSEWYLARQLRNFRSGIRGYDEVDIHGTQMRAMTLAVESAEVLDELARYLASLSPPEADTVTEGDVERGEQLYAVCAACHGADGLGKEELNAPALKGQHDEYLVRQLNNFRQGLRGAHADDTYGAPMVPIMNALPAEQDIIDVVAYINTL
jgi:cytochrome c oxidase subunit 2